jgi:hypothetical protein
MCFYACAFMFVLVSRYKHYHTHTQNTNTQIHSRSLSHTGSNAVDMWQVHLARSGSDCQHKKVLRNHEPVIEATQSNSTEDDAGM